ncbi:helix-turn-helix domain-containing protein [Halomicrobium urmianum]|uniref:helix-turn-helix domain-containing protein n=1 Tax=Halomicrobium urmianum TaxID=1586233 RepID=UPI001CDA4060|nr:bacterio-opsin activator domain-containing protein [Halomicrobium urmianum]
MTLRDACDRRSVADGVPAAHGGGTGESLIWPHAERRRVTMSVIGEFAVPASAVAMHRTLAAAPEMTVEIERVVAHEGGTLTPYFWIRGGDADAFEAAIREDPSVSDATRLDVHEGGTLYRAKWPPDVESVGHAYLQTGATILEATGRDDEWELRLRFDTHRDVAEFREYCADHGVAFDVERVYNPSAPKAGGQFGLTPKQREALVTALENGFYEVPQNATMDDVADAIGVSQQAVSKRLRRAHGNLVGNVLTVEEIASGD